MYTLADRNDKYRAAGLKFALTSGSDPFFIPTINYPDGYSLAFGEITPAHTFLLAPLVFAFGEIVAYNLAILVSTVFTGRFTFALARRWLARLIDQPDDAPIMEFPLSAALSGPGMYYTRFHGKPVTNGYGTYLPFLYRRQNSELLTFPSDESLDLLQTWGVHYVLVTTDTLTYERFTLADVAAQPRLQEVITLDNVIVYRLD